MLFLSVPFTHLSLGVNRVRLVLVLFLIINWLQCNVLMFHPAGINIFFMCVLSTNIITNRKTLEPLYSSRKFTVHSQRVNKILFGCSWAISLQFQDYFTTNILMSTFKCLTKPLSEVPIRKVHKMVQSVPKFQRTDVHCCRHSNWWWRRHVSNCSQWRLRFLKLLFEGIHSVVIIAYNVNVKK